MDGGRIARNYPHLSPEEFEEACHYFDRRYRQARLGLKRMQWKLRIRTALNVLFEYQETSRCLLEITKTLEDTHVDLDMLALDLAGKGNTGDQEMMDAEAEDTAIIQKQPNPRGDSGFVTYEIILHPTYQVPTLYFWFTGLPEGEDRHSIDTVFRRLVPSAYKEGLRSWTYGRVGGISIDVSADAAKGHHPMYGEPCFFVHPCLIGEGMTAFRSSLEDYLTVWIGLAGACVGLSIPMEMAPQQHQT